MGQRERAVILKDASGRPWAVQGVMVDITERKRVEEELERAWQRERETAAHLRELDDMKNLLLHAVAHDLRGPIATVLGSAMVLENSLIDLDEAKCDLIRGVGAGARKLNRLVNDLLDLERLERGLVEPDRRPTDVGELAHRVVGRAEGEVPRGSRRNGDHRVAGRSGPRGAHHREPGCQFGPPHPQGHAHLGRRPPPRGGARLSSWRTRAPGFPSTFGRSSSSHSAMAERGWGSACRSWPGSPRSTADGPGSATARGGASFEVFLPDSLWIGAAIPDEVEVGAT